MNENPFSSPKQENSGTDQSTLEPKINAGGSGVVVFFRWFVVAAGIQFLAWIAMFVIYPFRPVYFAFYYPIAALYFPGANYHTHGLGLFIFAIPIAGSLTYSVLAGCLGATWFRCKNRQITMR